MPARVSFRWSAPISTAMATAVPTCLATSNGPEDNKRLRARRDRVRQCGVRRFVGQILLAREEPQERPALLRDVVADCTPQHRIVSFKRIEDGALGDRALDRKFQLSTNVGQRSQMRRKYDSDRHFAGFLPTQVLSEISTSASSKRISNRELPIDDLPILQIFGVKHLATRLQSGGS